MQKRWCSGVSAAIGLVAAWSAVGPAHAVSVAWDEQVQGDLSNNPTSPTSGTFFFEGVNTIRGSFSGSSDPVDSLALWAVLTPEHQIDAIYLTQYTDVFDFLGGPGEPGVISIQADNGTPSGAELGTAELSVQAFGPSDNLLETLALAPLGGTGFDVPLTFASQRLVLEQTGSGLVDYELEVHVSVVTIPEPGCIALMALSGLAWGFRRQSSG